MKKVVLSIQTRRQMRMCSLGRLPAPPRKILCLQWRAAHGGGMYEYGAGSLRASAHTQTPTARARAHVCRHACATPEVSLVHYSVPKISCCLQPLPDRSGSSWEGRSRARGCERAPCTFVPVWLLCARKKGRALPYSVWYKAPAPIMHAGSSGRDEVRVF